MKEGKNMGKICEICGKSGDLDMLLIAGMPRVCASCANLYNRAKRGEISLDEVITNNTSEELSKALKDSLKKSRQLEMANELPAEKKNSGSTIGTAIKALSVIIAILSVLGSLVWIIKVDIAIGLSLLLASLLFCFLSYGIGELCTLLSDIKSHLSNKKSE